MARESKSINWWSVIEVGRENKKSKSEKWKVNIEKWTLVMGTFKSRKIKLYYIFILIFMGAFHGLNCQTSQNINVRKYAN